jgi:dipeptidyl aminopeptidase/acylaminoacyl peptidase
MNLLEKAYRKNLFIRNDNPNGIFYFTPADFDGLQAHPYTFPSSMGHELKGYFYHYENPIPNRLVVFDHGMGNGHRAYMREIERLAKAGFLVFSYDHTGCMESGGESTNGFAQSLKDLDDCFKALKAEPALAGRSFSVMGHSWGSFSTMNIVSLHPEITHVVSMSGFVSVKRMLEQTFAGILKGAVKTMYGLEKRANPDYVDFDAVQSLKETSAKVLLIASSDDKIVKKEYHFDVLQQALAGRENISFLLTEGKGHNPSYTCDAVRYKDAFFAEFQKAVKKKQLETARQQKEFMARYDWKRMTAQDEAVWQVIVQTLRT